MYDSHSLKEKEVFFTKFLNDVLANEELRAWKYLEEFLTVKGEKAYKPIRKKNEKFAVRPSELSDYSTIDGKVSINVSPANYELCKNYNNVFVNKFQSIYKDLEDATDEIEKNSLALSKSIQKYSFSFEQLSDLYTEVGFDEFTDLYNNLRDLTTLFSESVLEQAKVIKSHLSYDFKYHYFEADSYKELSKLKNDVEYTFRKWKRDLKFKKEKLWTYKNYNDFSKWNLSPGDLDNIDEIIKDEDLAKSKMLPRETEFVKNKLHLLHYIENQCVKEIRRWGRLQWGSLKEKFARVSKEQCKILNKMHVYWADFNIKHA